MLASLKARDLARVLPFYGSDYRRELTGILVEPLKSGGCILTASNGHILGSTYSPMSTAESPFILNMSKPFAKAVSARNADHVAIGHKDSNAIVYAQSVGKVKKSTYILPGESTIDDEYPNWRKTVPKETQPGIPSTYDLKYLRTLLDACITSSGTPFPAYRFRCATEDADRMPLILIPSAGVEFFAMLMPLRDHKDTEPNLSWLNEPVMDKA